MIRPLTCLAFLLACGSGLYLYQVKHRVKLLDDQIGAIVKSTDTLREQTRMLSAEWTLLNDPERLQKLADQFLTLQTVSPNQFTSLADLDSRLPPPLPQGAPPAPAVAAPVVAEQTPAATAAGPAATQPDAATAPDTAIAAAGNKPGGPAVPQENVAADAARVTAATPRVAAGDDITAATPRIAASSDHAAHIAGDGHAAPAVVADGSVTRPAAADDRPAHASGPDGRIGTRHVTPDQPVRLADHRPLPRAAMPAPRLATSQPQYAQRDADRRAQQQREAAQRSFVPRAIERRPVMAARLPAPTPAAGSFLGMAHDMPSLPAPTPMGRPMRVSAPISYSAAGG